jgi:hypothetical protein
MCFMTDSTYTERYMGLPNLTDNYQGYNEGDLSKHVDQLKDKQFLLVSWGRDDLSDILLDFHVIFDIGCRFTGQLTTMSI